MTGAQRPWARRLEIVVGTSPGALPVLVAAGLVSAAACSAPRDVSSVAVVGVAGIAGTNVRGGFGVAAGS